LITGISLLLVAGGIAITPLLILWYRSREFVPAYLASLLTIPLAGLAGPATARLERDLNFRAVASIELGGQLLALFVSATLAWFRLGVWAPVTGLLVWQAWAAGAAMKAAALWPRPAIDRAQAKAMLSFGLGYSASLRVWQLRSLVNPLLVGRSFGAEGVAFVGLAIRIGEGLGFIRAAATRLAIATLSRAREKSDELKPVLQRGLTLQILALGPLLCVFALAAPFIIPRVLGARWMPAMQIYPFIAAGVLVNALYNLQASALFVVGRQWIVLRGYIAQVSLLAIGTLILLPYVGLRGYGWAELFACAAYGILHRAIPGTLRVSYRKLAPLTFAFLAPPFALLVKTNWTFLFWLPLVVIGASFAYSRVFGHGAEGKWEFSLLPLIQSSRSRIA
jgi:O-antigen/teichoic acid export membrane protein